MTGNNLNSLSVVEIYGQKYSVVKLVPLQVVITCVKTETGAIRYLIVPTANIGEPTNTKNYLITYALISPEFWVDRDATYISNEIDFHFNIKDMNVAEDFVDFPSGGSIVSTSQYFGKMKILGDELITFPEINWQTPLMWTYWDTPQSNPSLVFKSSNRNATTDFKVFFTATLIKLHIIPDDLIEPTV